METLLDRSTIENTEQERHNAMIKERYRRILDAAEDQLSTPVIEEETARVSTAYASVASTYDTLPIVEQAPTVTEYAPSKLAASVFTPAKFDRMEDARPQAAPVAVVAPAKPVSVSKTVNATEAHYSLTPLAKVVMAIFTLVVTTMLILIGVNSQTIERKNIRLRNLEEKKQELMEKNEELQRYIEELQTEDSILERAAQAGLIN